MSSILKALKRLEEEKAAKYGERVDSAGGILRGSVGSRRSHMPLVAGVVVLTAVVAVIVTYALMGGFRASPQSVASPAIPRNMPEPVQALQPPAPSQPEKQVQPVSPPARQQARPEATGSAPAPATPPAAAVAPEVVQPKPAATDTAPKPVLPPPGPSTPVLKVSAIAWQKEGAGLIAMVNGTSVGTGAKVGGARVEEILPDRVRFSYEGHSFEILLGKSAPEK